MINLAKTIACLDRVSEGRFILSIGAGWNAEEMADHGVNPRSTSCQGGLRTKSNSSKVFMRGRRASWMRALDQPLFAILEFSGRQPCLVDYLFAFELLDFGRRHPEDLAQDFLAMLPKHGCRTPQCALRPTHAMLESFVWRRTHLAVIEPLPKPEFVKVLVAMNVHAILHRIRGYAGGLECAGQLFGASGTHE